MVMEYDSEKIVRPFRELMSQIGNSAPAIAVKGGIEKGIRATTGNEFSFSDNSDGTRV